MDNEQKWKIIAESLSVLVSKDDEKYRKVYEKRLRHDDLGGKELFDFIGETIKESQDNVYRWEETKLDQLGGLTPKEYFESLGSIDDFVGLVSVLVEKCGGILPTSLAARVKNLQESVSGPLGAMLGKVQVGEDGCLSPLQQAEVHIAEVLGQSEFLQPLKDILHQFGDKTDEGSYKSVGDALVAIGEPALRTLIELAESIGRDNKQYDDVIQAVARIGEGNRSEDVYRFLKECFRKSDTKVAEVSALAMYGDGRAVPLLRTYIERNIEDMPGLVYTHFRECLASLGGIVSDLDDHYRSLEDEREREED